MFSIVLNEILYIGVSLEFRAETIEGKHYLSVYNSAIPWLMKEYDTIEEAETKLAGIINVVKTGSHIDLDTLLADVEE
jgi:hypothetical protein